MMRNSQPSIETIVKTLRSNVYGLQEVLSALRVGNEKLEAELSRVRDENQQLVSELKDTKESLGVVAISNSFLGDIKQKDQVKKRIGLLINKVDDCVKYWSLNS